MRLEIIRISSSVVGWQKLVALNVRACPLFTMVVGEWDRLDGKISVTIFPSSFYQYDEKVNIE